MAAVAVGLSFVARHDPAVWLGVAFFALIAVAIGTAIVFPYEMRFRVDRDGVQWTSGRRRRLMYRPVQVQSIYIDCGLDRDYSSVLLANGDQVRLPDELFRAINVDVHQLCARWSALWPQTPICLHNESFDQAREHRA